MPAKVKKPVSVPREQMYVSWGNEREKAVALHEASEALLRVEPVVRSRGSNIFMNIAPAGVSVRDGMGRDDYEDFRRESALPTSPKGLIRAGMDAYRSVGIIRNVIDLMADFATQGIDLVHPNERIEKWWKEWFRRVRGKERSERFLNLLYRTGNVIVKRHTAKLPVKVEDEMRRSQADPDMDVEEKVKLARREIPWRYTFLNPLNVEVVSDELALFVGQDDMTFAMKVPRSLAQKINNPRTAAERRLVAKLPEDVRKAVKNGERLIPLDPQKVKGWYYKRDDWQVWASPMVDAILADLQLLQKMKLADLAALDGAVSCIRVWKLGSEEHKILPGPAAINRLAEMLCNNVGGGVMDLVWDFAIDLVETSTDVHQFLGNTKYEPVLTAIYAGLGIPPTLTGAATQGGFTNNFISLKTLTERLQYGRDLLASMWQEEIRLTQQAMKFRFPAELVYDRMVLSDEAAEKQLLLNLWDRNLISDETIQERFREVPEIERVRTRREWRKREQGDLPAKASPFHKAEKGHEKEMAFINQGVVTPSEAGVEFDEKKPGEKSMLDRKEETTVKQTKLQMESQKDTNDHQFRMERLQLKHGVHPAQMKPNPPKGQPGQGRPRQSKDSQKRKQKRVLPRTSAVFFETMAWAENAQTSLGQVAGKAYLAALGKNTLRELTDEEARSFEGYKFHALCGLEPGQKVDEAVVASLSRSSLDIPTQVADLLRATVARHVEKHGREPSLAELRLYQAGVYALWKGDFGEAQ